MRTDWSMIGHLVSGDEAAESAALEQIVRRYWPAIFAYVRRCGRDPHEAADITQGFVCDIVIGRRLIHGADPTRGRLRSLVLTALRNYVRQRSRQAHAARRAPRSGPPLSLDGGYPEPDGRDGTPEAAFDRQWSATLVRRVLEQVREACLADGLEAHWMIFEARVVRPVMLGEPATDYDRLVAVHELSDPAQAANMIVTVKRRFVRALQQEVGSTLASHERIDDEIHQLLRDLGGGG
jgi:RNA polymerase sigma-70 factor (ECF subfamily)